jgi:hypothetical protein
MRRTKVDPAPFCSAHVAEIIPKQSALRDRQDENGRGQISVGHLSSLLQWYMSKLHCSPHPFSAPSNACFLSSITLEETCFQLDFYSVFPY